MPRNKKLWRDTQMIYRNEDGRIFRRPIFGGHKRKVDAEKEAKMLWHLGHAVRVERGWGRRWHVWRSVP